jgi:hypothetical protein
MIPDPKSAQLLSYLEAKKNKHGHQIPESGYAGVGYWFNGYPVYLGGGNTMYGAMNPVPNGPNNVADVQGSKLEGAAQEAGATSDGQNSGTSGTGGPGADSETGI